MLSQSLKGLLTRSRSTRRESRLCETKRRRCERQAVGPIERLDDRTLLAAVSLQLPTATVSASGLLVDGAIDGDPKTGWGISTATGGIDSTLNEVAAFETGKDINFAQTQFRCTMFSGSSANATLDLFRLSVTDSDRSAFADGFASGGDVTANWTELVPTVAVAKPADANGNPAPGLFPVLTIRPDNSIIVGGSNPDYAIYEVTAKTTVTGITGIRLQVIDDDTTALPTGGPGRETRGNFILRELPVDAVAIVSEPTAIRGNTSP